MQQSFVLISSSSCIKESFLAVTKRKSMQTEKEAKNEIKTMKLIGRGFSLEFSQLAFARFFRIQIEFGFTLFPLDEAQ